MFKPLVFNTKMTHADILSKYSKGLDYAQVLQARDLYGDCQIEVP